MKKSKQKIQREKQRLENTSMGGHPERIGGILEITDNTVKQRENFKNLFSDLPGDIPSGEELFGETKSVTLREAFNIHQGNAARFKADLTKAEFLARYDYLFRNTTDAIRTSLENTLKETNLTIKESYEPLNDLVMCTSGVVERQCKSSE